eukprot:NODE_1562_length_1112_cov_235.403974.p5 GENE.NODE_1562_length_1112_cov_235.403974~~NODE_1562_length_1112_cov_235.403974.p5  ORF type:complete len:89 (+),score=28.79 NODE_1562_length_1112_cov_235.403974:815-1081(+)
MSANARRTSTPSRGAGSPPLCSAAQPHDSAVGFLGGVCPSWRSERFPPVRLAGGVPAPIVLCIIINVIDITKKKKKKKKKYPSCSPAS